MLTHICSSITSGIVVVDNEEYTRMMTMKNATTQEEYLQQRVRLLRNITHTEVYYAY